ncbi:hypothetical protein F1188_16115 [Roseospira marina]|uniref:Uncharacterized protein n=1 Tax=Roseospira marina TaxID=140057 RepID=A0A5M6I9I6_9PROT|nr:hypothetical protein [Roseospira marina]KAA5604385.1 hypothetical protein F1188_16115 [Roseospira marina]MBB4315426.1 ABC-type siderophore export system fused ATPase/permease subunit [Roseospira marina]MBB5088428.1 ABC-type siderophore export system fused ATPase/permease subunit [Roseospira marina]
MFKTPTDVCWKRNASWRQSALLGLGGLFWSPHHLFELTYKPLTTLARTLLFLVTALVTFAGTRVFLLVAGLIGRLSPSSRS